MVRWEFPYTIHLLTIITTITNIDIIIAFASITPIVVIILITVIIAIITINPTTNPITVTDHTAISEFRANPVNIRIKLTFSTYGNFKVLWLRGIKNLLKNKRFL